jgi:hypothetical protein
MTTQELNNIVAQQFKKEINDNLKILNSNNKQLPLLTIDQKTPCKRCGHRYCDHKYLESDIDKKHYMCSILNCKCINFK